MNVITIADSPDSALQHAEQLAAWTRLIALQRRFAAQFAAQDRADRIADRVLALGFGVAGVALAAALLALR